MRLVRCGRSAVLSTAMGSALGLLTSQACVLDRSSLGEPSTSIDGPVTGLAPDAGAVLADPGLLGLDSAVAPPPRSDVDGGLPVPAPPPVSGCDLTGTFAVQFEAQVRWQGTTLFGIVPIITPGNGKLSVTVLSELSNQGGARAAQIRACGAATPDFSSSVDETYGVAFPDEVWEKLALRWAAALSAECTNPGCAIETTKIVAQMGLGIPETAAWPTSRDPLSVATLRDDDGDGIPGILLRCRGPKDPGNYTHPPTSYLLSQRVSEIMMAIRLGAALDGKLESCDRFSGSITGMTIDTRALACQLDSGARCGAEQLGFVDDNLPVWKVENAKFTALRLPTGASCADARAATP